MMNCAPEYNRFTLSRKRQIDYYIKKHTDGKPAAFANFADGLFQLAQQVDWEKYGNGSLTMDLFKSADEMIQNITGAKSLTDYLNNADEKTLEAHMNKMKGYVQILSGAMEDPIGTMKNRDIAYETKSALEYYLKYNDLAMRNKLELTWNPFRAMYNIAAAPNVIIKNPFTGKTIYHYMTNLAAAYRMHDASNKALVEVEAIQNSTTKITEDAENYCNRILKEAATRNISKVMLDDLINYTDPSLGCPELPGTPGVTRAQITDAIKQKVFDAIEAKYQDELKAQPDQNAYKQEVYNKILQVRGQINKLWYGVSDPYVMDDDGNVHKIKASDIISMSNKIDYGNGVYGDSFLKNYFVNGKKLYEIVKNMKDPPKHIENYIKKWADIDNVGFRMNYLPLDALRELDDAKALEFYQTAAKGFSVEFSHSFSRSDEHEYSVTDKTSFLNNMNDYLKEYRFVSHVKAGFALAKMVNQYMSEDNSLSKSNPEAYAMLLHRSESDLDRYLNPKAKGKEVSPLTLAFKNSMYGLSGLAIACRITGSPFTNLMAAMMNSMIKQPVTSQLSKRKQFKNAQGRQDILGDMAREIQHDSDNYNILSKMTTVINKEVLENQKFMQKKALEAIPSVFQRVPVRFLEAIAKGSNTASDRLMNSFYGITPRSWEFMSMAGTENMLMKQAAAEAYNDSYYFGMMWTKTRGLDIDNLSTKDKSDLYSAMQQNYETNTALHYNTIKQMYGAYTSNVKAAYAGDYMKDANNLFSITFGQMLIMHSAFKQISVNNADMIARIKATDLKAALKTSDLESPVNLNGAGLVVMLGLWNFVRDKVLFEKFGKRIANVGLLTNADIFEDASRKYKMLDYTIRSAMGAPVTQEQILDAAQYWKFLIGVGVNFDSPRFTATKQGEDYEIAVKEYEGMMDVIKEYCMKNYYPMGNMVSFIPLWNQGKGIYEAMTQDNITPNARKAIIKDAMSRGQFYADGGNKLLRLTGDLAVLLSEAKETYLEGEGKSYDELKYKEYVLGILNRTSQLHIYVPSTPYKSNKGYNVNNAIDNLTRLENIIYMYEKQRPAKANYYRQHYYEATKAFNHAINAMKPPSWDLKRTRSDIIYNK